MSIPYRTRRALSRIAFVLAAILMVAVLVWMCWLLWLGRYVLYTKDQGAILDFSLNAQLPAGNPALREPEETVPINYDTPQEDISTELTQISGYYVDAATLEKKGGIATVRAQLEQLPAGTPILLDLKSIYGNFFYSSSVSDRRNSDLDIAAMDELLAYLRDGNFYTIARMPAFQDRFYARDHMTDGLRYADGIGLWEDNRGTYWLNPTTQGTISYLVQIINELKLLGFDEVVFRDFCFPDTTNILFKEDKAAAISNAAQVLVTTCATDTFAVSFVGGADFPLPQGRSRLYMENVAAANAATLAQQTGIADTAVHLAFLTDLHDTRFDAFCVLRPLSGAH